MSTEGHRNGDFGTVTAWRLLSQQIARSKMTTAEQVVRWLGGVQAQDASRARWSIGLRLPGSTAAAVAEAIENGSIVRTWAFRGTLHFISAADVSWLTAFLGPLILKGNRRRYRQLELTETDFARSNETITLALAQDGRLTRSQIAAALEAAGVSPAGQRLPYLIQHAALDGLIRHGPLQGRESTYLLLDDSIPARPDLTGEAALAELAQRYFKSHGPATVQDFAWWSGLTMSEARRGLEMVKASFLPLEIDGQRLWAAEEFEPSSALTAAHLLPPFDEYLLGYRDRRAALDAADVKNINAGGGMPKPAILLNGKIVGIWRDTVKRDRVQVTHETFRALTEPESAAVAEAKERFIQFLHGPAQ